MEVGTVAIPVTVVQAYFDAINKGDADAAADTFTPTVP